MGLERMAFLFVDRFGYLGCWGQFRGLTGLLSNQGEKSINFYFRMVPLSKKVLKYGTPKPGLGF